MTKKILFTLGCMLLFSVDIYAQAGESMYALRTNLYEAYDSLFPYFARIAGGMGIIGGIGSLMYVSYRAYQMLMLNEQFDIYPLFKPFGLGFLLMFYPAFLSLMNAIGDVPVNYTNALVGETNETIEMLLNRKMEETSAWKWYSSDDSWGDYGSWIDDNDIDTGIIGEGHIPAFMNFAGEQLQFQVKTYMREFLFSCLSVLYYGCSLLIDVARIFFLLVLSFLGPIAIIFSLFDTFSNSLMGWLTRYAHVYLWLPIANIYGYMINSVQINMIQGSIAQIQEKGESVFDSTDMAMLVFLFFAAMGYFTIPTVASWIISPGHGDMGRAMNSVNAVPNTISSAAGAATGLAAAGVAGAVGARAASSGGGDSSSSNSSGSSASAYQQNLLTK